MPGCHALHSNDKAGSTLNGMQGDRQSNPGKMPWWANLYTSPQVHVFYLYRCTAAWESAKTRSFLTSSPGQGWWGSLMARMKFIAGPLQATKWPPRANSDPCTWYVISACRLGFELSSNEECFQFSSSKAVLHILCSYKWLMTRWHLVIFSYYSPCLCNKRPSSKSIKRYLYLSFKISSSFIWLYNKIKSFRQIIFKFLSKGLLGDLQKKSKRKFIEINFFTQIWVISNRHRNQEKHTCKHIQTHEVINYPTSMKIHQVDLIANCLMHYCIFIKPPSIGDSSQRIHCKTKIICPQLEIFMILGLAHFCDYVHT